METVNHNASGEDKVYHLIERLGDKLDALILSLPSNYVQKVEYDPWRVLMEGRLLVLENDAKTNKDWNNTEHKGIADAVVQSERRIMAELKSNTQKTEDNARVARSSRLTIWLCVIGWLITIVLFIVSMLLAYHVW